MKTKRITSAILALCLLLTLCPGKALASAGVSAPASGTHWSYADNVLTFTGNVGTNESAQYQDLLGEVQKLVLSASVKSVTADSLKGLTELQTVEVASGNTTFKSEDGVLYMRHFTPCQ